MAPRLYGCRPCSTPDVPDMKLPALAALLLLGAAPAIASVESPFEWLEQVSSERSMAWVEAENAKVLPALTGDARFAPLQADALAILSARDRIPTPSFVGEMVFNFWQDAEHVRGIWRRTTLESFHSDNPQWETVLDLDALATTEKANWIWKGADCRPTTHDRCLVRLSNGGKDAIEIREFDLKTKTFVEGGNFMKQYAERGLDKSGIKVIGPGDVTDDDLLNGMGDAVLGTVTAHIYSAAHPSAMNKSFVADYNKAFGTRPGFMAVGGWDGIHLVYEASKKTGGKTDGD
eukprot:gene33503-44859_t